MGELTLEAVDDGLRPAEAVSLTVVDDDVDVLTRGRHRVGHELGLRHRDDEIVGALEEEQLAVQIIDVEER